MKLKDIISRIDKKIFIGNPEVKIKSICYDSRKAKEGSLFVAISGFKNDGHNFVQQAYSRGARTFVVERMVDLPPDISLIKVTSSREALAKISSIFYGFPSDKLKLIGVTGTNGKTTITYFLQAIFKKAGLKVGRLSTVNYDLGDKIYPALTTTPESLDLQRFLREMVDSGIEYAFMEVSSHSLVLHRVDEVRFCWAVFTNLSPEHLDFHQDMESYLEAKLILFEKMPQDKKALVNLDDPYSKKIIEKSSCQIITYAIDKNADYRARILQITDKGSLFMVKINGKDEIFKISLPGSHNVYNALAAIVVAKEEKIPINLVREGLEDISRIPGRLEFIENRAGLKIYVDYAHTPNSLERVLNTLRRLTGGKLVVVFGCGGDRDPYKRPLMGKIACRIADYTVVTSDNPRSEEPEEIILQIERGMLEEGAIKGKDYVTIPDRREAIKHALSRIVSGDTLLVAGKGHERVQILKDKVIPFDDRAVIRDLLRESNLL